MEKKYTNPNNIQEEEINMNIIERKLADNMHLFEGCGNMLGIVSLTEAGFSPDYDFREDASLREFLANWGREINSDSVMILRGVPENHLEQGYHVMMQVFEPNGTDDNGLAGGVSTMCGNGVRAVAAYIREKMLDVEEVKIMTESGLRTIDIENELYTVNMGNLAIESSDLSRYVNADHVTPGEDGRFRNSPIPNEIASQLVDYLESSNWSIGLTGTAGENGRIDGEPHVVISLNADKVKSIAQLRSLAVKYGPIITKNQELFPEEINVNFVVRTLDSNGNLSILNCTHERNLGDDPDHSVTAACGTGSTVAGALVLLEQPSLESVLVINTGGDLLIGRDGDEYLMKGPAERVN